MNFEDFKLGTVFYTRPNSPRRWKVVTILLDYGLIKAIDDEGIIATFDSEDFPKCRKK